MGNLKKFNLAFGIIGGIASIVGAGITAVVAIKEYKDRDRQTVLQGKTIAREAEKIRQEKRDAAKKKLIENKA